MSHDYAQLHEGTEDEVAEALKRAFEYVWAVEWIEGPGKPGNETRGVFEPTPCSMMLSGFGTSEEGVRYVKIGDNKQYTTDAEWLRREAVRDCIHKFERNAGWKILCGVGEERIEPEERLQIATVNTLSEGTPFWIHRLPTRAGARTSLRRAEIDVMGRPRQWPGSRCRVGPVSRNVIRKLGDWSAKLAAERNKIARARRRK